jgi:hypothetical protein
MRGTAPAPIYGPFPGLDQVIKGADFIVVTVIEKRPEMLDMGNGGIFEIQVLKVLKGNTKEGKGRAYLRDLPFDLGSSSAIGSRSLTNEFMQGQLYLLFLCKPGTHIHDENGKPPPVDYEDENCAGDAIWINQQHADGYELNELNSLNGKSARDSIVTLLQHTSKRHRDFANAVDAIIAGKSAE